MKKIISLISTLAFSMALLGCATTGEQDADRPGVEMSSIETLSATVEAVDHEKRLVTLRGQEVTRWS
jgi:hypothetical protein